MLDVPGFQYAFNGYLYNLIIECVIGMKVEEHEEKLKPAIAKMFSIMHKSVSEYSQKMLDELKRHNYVTPTNYLELVSGYKS